MNIKQRQKRKHGLHPKKKNTNCCVACGSKGKWHNHHVTYRPERTVRLCIPCHHTITSLNTARRDVVDRPLSNKERSAIYHCFLGVRRKNPKFLQEHRYNGKQIFSAYKKSNYLTEEFINIVSA